MGVSSNKEGSGSETEIGNTGLLSGHAYGLLDIKECKGNQLLKISN